MAQINEIVEDVVAEVRSETQEINADAFELPAEAAEDAADIGERTAAAVGEVGSTAPSSIKDIKRSA